MVCSAAAISVIARLRVSKPSKRASIFLSIEKSANFALFYSIGFLFD
ncbi:Uncharacterised protein [Vibrio cholerae]|nr:Uncharacterised protein [Vibrio cholerae]